jgi:hypothetical protein
MEINKHINKLLEFIQQPLIIGILCFGVLVSLNAAYLFNPPYWDDMFSPHNQALWLRNNNFDFFKLWHEGGNFWDGGSNVYPFSLVAVLYGVLYSIFSPKNVHFIGHLINISCISISFAISYKLIARFIKIKPVALLWCISALFEPVMAGRTAALGRESILGMLVVYTIYLVATKHYWKALVIMSFSFFIKPTGILLFCTNATFLAALFVLKNDYFNFKRNRLYLCCFAVTFLIIMALYKVTSIAQGGAFLKLGTLWGNIIHHFGVLMPLSAILLIVLIITALLKVYFICLPHLKARSRLKFDDELAALLFSIIFICGFWVAFLIFKIPLPRYTVITVFPIFIFLGISIKNAKAALAFTTIFSLVSFSLWYGSNLPAIPAALSRSGDLLERSREYIEDLKGNQKTCRFLEKHFYNHVIVAKGPFLQMLTLPEYGYVSKALPNVLSAAKDAPKYCPVSVVVPSKLNRDALFIYSRNVCEYGMDDYYLVPYRSDKIIYVQGALPVANVIYMKNPKRKLLTLKEFELLYPKP